MPVYYIGCFKKRIYFTVLPLLFLCLLNLDTHARTIRVNQASHPLHAYAVGALRIAIQNMPGTYNVQIDQKELTQTRTIEELEKNNLDLMWMASNAQVEEILQPIRFPILKGLLGHRICIIKPESQNRFSNVKSFADLKELTFGQGQSWPDTGILRENDLQVVTTSKYHNLFYMVEGGRFDGFPRGANEPWTEISSRPELGLTVDTELVLIYRLPFYLFVRPEDQALAEAIHKGFEAALANGHFDAYFYSDPMVKDALERSGMKTRRAFNLVNPNLHPQTPLEREDYWLDLKAL